MNNPLNYIHNTDFQNPYTALASGYPVGENNLDLLSYIERTKAYIEEYKYNLSLAVSKFKLNGAKENKIDEPFFFSVLIEIGSICGFFPERLKTVVTQPYCATRWNYYVHPTEVNLIPYYANGVTLEELGLASRTLKQDDFEIIYLNKTKIGFRESLAYEARLCSMLDMCFLNNVYAKSLNLILQGSSDELNDVKQLLNKILNQNGIIGFDTGSRPDALELLKSVDLNIEWLGDKIAESKKQLRAELHERLGITHAPYEKRERLINAEIETQNEATDLLSQSTLDTINEGLDKLNNKFSLEVPLSVSLTDIGIDEGAVETENINEVRDNEFNTSE